MQGSFDDGKVGKDIRDLLNQIEKYLRLDAVDKMTVMLTGVIVGGISFALATSAVFFLSTGLVKSLALVIGDEIISYFAVGILLLLLMLLVSLFRKSLIENKVVRQLSASLLGGVSITDSVFGGYEKKARSESDLSKLARSLAEELDEYDEEGGAR